MKIAAFQNCGDVHLTRTSVLHDAQRKKPCSSGWQCSGHPPGIIVMVSSGLEMAAPLLSLF